MKRNDDSIDFQLERLEDRHMLAVNILAAGQTNEETMQLLVDGQVVQTWTNVGGNAEAGYFAEFSFEVAADVTPDRVAIAFVNDAFDPANGLDRNLRLGDVEINGHRISIGSPNVFSTGTWRPNDGIVPGFSRGDTLHSNGTFSFGGAIGGNVIGDGTGSVIVVNATGETGLEQYELTAGDEVLAPVTVGPFFASPRIFQIDEFVSIEDIQVAFTNDFYDPANGINRTLFVDSVVLDGVVYETEAPTTFSTGTWNSEDGAATPGFRETDRLDVNGFFQLRATPPTTVTVHAAGEVGKEAFRLSVAGQSFAPREVTQSLDTYTFEVDGPVSISSVEIEFLNDFYEPANSINHTLIVDKVEIDGVAFETEAPSTFSTGTWRPEDGVTPGFRQSERLDVNGFFQYDAGVDSPDYRIDTSFGNGGSTNFGQGSPLSWANSNSTIAVFSAEPGEPVYFFNTDGTLNSDFANTGVVFLGAKFDEALGRSLGGVRVLNMDLDSQGRLVARATYGFTGESTLIRVNTDGSLDTSFGLTGVEFLEGISDFQVNGNDDLVLTGSRRTIFGGEDGTFVRRYDSSGTLIYEVVDSSALDVEVLQFRDDGTVIVTRTSENGSADQLRAYTANGQLDAGFGVAGIVDLPAFTFLKPSQDLIDSQGRFIVGLGLNSFARFLPNGQIDLTFGTDGVATIQYTIPDGPNQGTQLDSLQFQNLTVDAQDRLVGLIPLAEVVFRLDVNGMLDTTFSDDGVQTTLPFANVFNDADVILPGDGGTLLAFGSGIQTRLADLSAVVASAARATATGETVELNQSIVKVVERSGTVIVTGDAGNNDVSIVGLGDGSLSIVGTNTLIQFNGVLADSHRIPGDEVDRLRIRLRGGDDELRIMNFQAPSAELRVSASLGQGDDVFQSSFGDPVGQLDIAGNGGNDSFLIDEALAGNTAHRLRGSSGINQLRVAGRTLNAAPQIQLRAVGFDEFLFDDFDEI